VAADWLQANKSRFVGEVSVPWTVSAEDVEIEDTLRHGFEECENECELLNNALFKFSSKDDLKHFMQVMRKELKLSIHVSMMM